MKVLVLGNWTDVSGMFVEWVKQSQDGTGGWNQIQLVKSIPFDVLVVINGLYDWKPLEYYYYIKEKHPNVLIYYFSMEPYFSHPTLVEWENFIPPDPTRWFHYTHSRTHNLGQWHLSLSYSSLLEHHPVNKFDLVSSIQSQKNHDEGHKRRLEFCNLLDTTGRLDMYGSYGSHLKNYKGQLPWLQKEGGLLPYKYHFAAENNRKVGYITEKLLDGILCECLVFYYGAPNVLDYVPADAIVLVSLEDLEADKALVEQAIQEDWWSKRLPAIREAKKFILEKYQFFPHLEGLLGNKLDSLE